MIRLWDRLLKAVDQHGAAASVQVVAVRGSAPREAGAAMVVRPDGGFWGTIGGGALEWEAIARARDALEQGRGAALRRDWPLGPDLGQCCGGVVATVTETFDTTDRPALAALADREAQGAFFCIATPGIDGRVTREPAAAGQPVPPGGWREEHGARGFGLALFGAGHVGRALVLALAPLPVAVTWIDPRAEAFPAAVPQSAAVRVERDPAAAVATLEPGAAVLVMTHSHPLDLAIVAAALARDDLGPVGLIGSATKRARFLSRLAEAGLAEPARRRLVCPIGLPGIGDKDPAMIAASVAAQVLLWRQEALQRDAARQPADRSGTAGKAGAPSGSRRANPPAGVRIGRGRRAGGRS